nr:hypothetical protein [uncultured Mediterranean phage uvMED]
MGVLKLAGVETKLADTGKAGVVLPLAVNAGEDVAGLSAVGIQVEVLVTADELVAAQCLDGADGFRDWHLFWCEG